MAESQIKKGGKRLGGWLIALTILGAGWMFFYILKPADTTFKDQAILQQDSHFNDYNNSCDQKKYEEAYQAAKKLVERYPENGGAWNCLGYSAEQLEKKNESMEAYEHATKISPHHARAWFNLGVSYENLGRYADGIDCYKRAVKLRPTYAKAWHNLSWAYYDIGKLEKSEAARQQALASDPNLVMPEESLSKDEKDSPSLKMEPLGQEKQAGK